MTFRLPDNSRRSSFYYQTDLELGVVVSTTTGPVGRETPQLYYCRVPVGPSIQLGGAPLFSHSIPPSPRAPPRAPRGEREGEEAFAIICLEQPPVQYEHHRTAP